MSALTDRIAEALRDAVKYKSVIERQCIGDNAEAMAEGIAEALQLAEERHWVSNRRGVLHHAIVGWAAVEGQP